MIQTKKKIQRQEEVLSSLADLTYATRQQLQIINNLSGDRNARRVLYEMEKDGLIKSVRYDKKVYYLSSRGSDRIDKGQTRLKKSWITHTLMRNDLYIRLGMPKTWKKEAPTLVNGEVLLISDARFKSGDSYYFVEIDNTQTMRTNNDKIKRYSELFKMVYREYGSHPTLIWCSLSTIRRNKLSASCISAGIKYKIY